MKSLIKSMGLATLLLASGEVKGDSIFRGMRGPSDWQADVRLGVSQRENKAGETTSVVNNNVLKYWDGDKTGKFSYLSIPFKDISAGNNYNSGLGDISFGFGPRVRYANSFGEVQILSHVGLVAPTGDTDKRPNLGNGRWDFKTGFGLTYLTPSKKKEVDCAFDYTLANGKNVSDDVSFGLLGAHTIGKNIRLGSGLIGTYKLGGKGDGDYVLTSRTALRYTFSKKCHLELWGDIDIAAKNLPSGFGITAMVRYNF